MPHSMEKKFRVPVKWVSPLGEPGTGLTKKLYPPGHYGL